MRINISKILFVFLCFILSISSANADVISDFSDGTLQGWTPDPANFAGTLQVAAGNPDFGMRGTDTGPGGIGLSVHAPAQYLGDLTGFLSLEWDEFLVNHGAANSSATGFILRGSDGTEYQGGFEFGSPRAVWNNKSLAFTETDWILRSGTSSFLNVLSNVSALLIGLDASARINVIESTVDNIRLVQNPVPLPAAVWLFGTGLIGLFGLKRKSESE